MLAFYQHANTEPALNLAIEEALMRNTKEDIFMLWRDDPCVVVGRNQNTLREISPEYISARGLPVVRRLSGGGAVYHDHGNLCFTYIDVSGMGQGDHSRYAGPVAGALNRMSIPAKMEGRNDVSVEGKKVSGNAQYIQKGKVCHHGTLLFDVDLDEMGKVLNPDISRVKGRGVASVRSRVVNLSQYLPGITSDDFARLLLRDFLKNTDAREHMLEQSILDEAEGIANQRYRRWEWNYGASPPYDYIKSGRFAGGFVELRLAVEEGIIKDAAVYGDFMSTGDMTQLTRALRGVKHERGDVSVALRRVDIAACLGGVKLDEFVSLF